MTDTNTRGIRMSDTTTRGIRIQVRSEFIPDRSSPRDGSYLFQYHVRISNVGAEVTQLWQDTGHELSPSELEEVAAWFRRTFAE